MRPRCLRASQAGSGLYSIAAVSPTDVWARSTNNTDLLAAGGESLTTGCCTYGFAEQNSQALTIRPRGLGRPPPRRQSRGVPHVRDLERWRSFTSCAWTETQPPTPGPCAPELSRPWTPASLGCGGGRPRLHAAEARPVPHPLSLYLWFTSSAIQVFGPTIPSCVSLYFFWKLLTAASVAGPNFPSTASFVKPYSLRSCH